MNSFSSQFVALPTFFFPQRTVSPDRKRRDAILRILLLASSSALFLVFSILAIARLIGYDFGYDTISSLLPFGVLLLCLFLLFLTKRGYGSWASWILLGLSFAFPAYVSYAYGAVLPQSLLTYALVIVMTGILISTTASFFVTALVSIFLIALMYGQQIGAVQADTSWQSSPTNVGNAFGFSICFVLIAIVSWLFNRHSERALEQARIFEEALKQERDQLEKTVYDRTEELRQIQSKRLIELQKFASFGKQATGFFHDLANPLTVISLSLEQVNEQRVTNKKAFKNMHMAIRDAITATNKIEEYIISTRSLLQNQEIKKTFSLLKEVQLAINILQPRAKKVGVKIELQAEEKNFRINGNNIKLHQVVSNLIANAIDAFSTRPDTATDRTIVVTVRRDQLYIVLTIEDTAGGIKPAVSAHMFEPFFSTKESAGHLGIGLAMCKEIIENDFGGTIRYQPTKQGSLFEVSFLKTL